MPSDIAISVKNLKKIYSTNNHDKKTALDNVSLNINKGSIFGLLGPNGAGKSTFINILADLVKKTSGEIEVLGINHEKNLKEVVNKPIKNLTLKFNNFDDLKIIKDLSKSDGETSVKLIIDNDNHLFSFYLKDKRKVDNKLLNSLDLVKNLEID